VLVITADVHERSSGVPELLEALGAHVEVRALTRGDYILGPETVVERKTVNDLHLSIAAGRFWYQMRKIRAAGRWPYLVIEGPSVFRGRVPPNGVRGLCLAVTDLGVAIIRTEHARDTAAWLLKLASRRCQGAIRDRPAYAQLPRSVTAPPPQAALAAAPGVVHHGKPTSRPLRLPPPRRSIPGRPSGCPGSRHQESHLNRRAHTPTMERRGCS
jgi:ERCC4-type nuclease